MFAPILPDEPERLSVLYEHEILDTAPDQAYDDLVSLAAHLCGDPVAAMTLIDGQRLWFKSVLGMEVSEVPRDTSICAHTVLSSDILLISDATVDERFSQNSMVIGEPHLRFYAGVPLISEDGHVLGSFCVIDKAPRQLTQHQLDILELLARQANSHLRATRRLADREKALILNEHLVAEKEVLLADRQASLNAVLENAPVILFATDFDGVITMSEGSGLQLLALKPGDAVGQSVYNLAEGDNRILEPLRRAFGGEPVSFDYKFGGYCLQTELRPMRNAKGMQNGILGVCYDVSERVESEERFRKLFECSSDAHLLLTDDGIVDCNPAAITLLNCTAKSEVLSLHPAQLSPEYQSDGQRSMEKCKEMDAIAVANGQHRFEWTHRKRTGEDFPVEVTLTPVQLKDRNALLVVWHDLTEQKRNEQAIRETALLLEIKKNQLEIANAELEALATIDGLTGLKNHRTFQEALVREANHAARKGSELSVVLLDVDNFKAYNDSFGHPAGDIVLASVAQLIQSDARESDLVARYGGEEFVVLMRQTSLSEAHAFAERLRVRIQNYQWSLRQVTASLGVASLHVGIESSRDVVTRADLALYMSKADGRNRVTVSPGVLHQELLHAKAS